jgi:TfoX/Sxy family transcriptional regulator of competence genes
MAYDEVLAGRVRDLLAGENGLTERKMFGGLGFMLDGAMAVAASNRGGLLLRVAPEDTADLLAEPGAQPFEMRGRVLTGWLRVTPEACATDPDLRRWVAIGVGTARSPTSAD